MENQHDNEMEGMAIPQKIRPTFLTVLCILTFIGSGWGIIDSVIDYSSADVAVESLDMVDDIMEDALEEEEVTESQSEFIENMFSGVSESMTAPNIRKMSIASLISCIFTLLGAILMWNLNKKGFYMYIIGTLIYIIAPAIIFSGIVAMAASGFMGFIGVIFIVLYGVNLKHMN